MILETTPKISPEDIYDKLVHINGINSYSLAMSYFDALYLNKDFWSIRKPHGLSQKIFTTYVDFAKYEVPWGLGWDIDVIKAHCRRKPNIWQEYESHINPLKIHGSNQHETGGSNLSPQVNRGRQYQIQRLKRDAPDIANKVIKREISAHKGMVMAGFKDKTVAVKCKADDFLTKAINNLEINQIEKLVQDLLSYLNSKK